MEFETMELDLPTHWATYFMNGDSSGMEPEEKKEVDDWWDANIEDGWDCVDISEDHWFASYHDGGYLAADVAKYTFMREKKGGE